ncbi:uncharacterized protein [Asterias amurensis]|uniref:uncharacterized protein n=1 Tax=Asterias amurensis TaxID=7602 RepID=UPI003AB52465
MDFGENVFLLLVLVCFANIAEVASQIDLGDFDLGDIGDILGDTDGIFDGGAVDQILTSAPGDGGSMSSELTCFTCATQDTQEHHSNCLAPTPDTVSVVTCSGEQAGHTPHCGALKATVSNAIAGNQEETSVIEWYYRGCVPIPNHREYGDKCFVNTDLDTKISELMGTTVKQLLGTAEDATVESEGCFCTQNLCNGAPSSFKFTSLIALPLSLAVNALLT